MFELSIALKYLLPKRKSLSSALISLMSVLVISLVVWLVLVFLSVTSGIEKNWLKKLTTLHAPVRISPTKQYYESYFYQIDGISSESNYTHKTIGEKQQSPISDPYLAELDAEIPSYIPQRESLDPVKQAFSILDSLQEKKSILAFQDYEMGAALMRLYLKNSAASISQMSYLLSIPDKNPSLESLVIQESTPSPEHAHFENGQLVLPDVSGMVPVILPKSYRENGIEIGDRGTFFYIGISGTSTQEQRIEFQVIAFYDPGIMSVGNKCILVPFDVTREIYASTQTFSPDGTPTNGIFVWTDSLTKARSIQESLQAKFEQAGIDSYWDITTYEDFAFAKDLLAQFRSDKTLLLIIAAIILIVACCNIISLLVLLVNDKKKEIAILLTMGASLKSIAAIFGLCGMVMGLLSCLFGSLCALLTLKHIDSLVSFLSLIQGREAFNPAFFGNSLPNSLSSEAFLFVAIVTPLLAMLAGLIPALKASRIQPATVLRTE